MAFSNFKPLERQRGAATLIVVLIVSTIMAVISLTTAYNALLERKLLGNDLRAREVEEAGEAGLEYGAAWAGKNNVAWPNSGNTLTCPGGSGCPTLPDITGFSTGETYTLSSLAYTRPNSASDFIRVMATAVAASDNSVTYTARTFVKPEGVLTTQGKTPPPLVLDDCMQSTTGTPDIYPNWTDLNADGNKNVNEWNDDNGNGLVDGSEWIDANNNGKVDNEMGEAIITSHAEYNGANFCLDYCGPGGSCDATSTATGHQHMDLHKGTLQNNVAYPNGSIWDYYFNVTQSQFRASAQTSLATAGGLYWITSSSNWAHDTYGSANDPVIIVFTNGCPKPNGNTTIYGILFFLDRNGCVNDPMNGWGNVTVVGSVGINGGVSKMNANFTIRGVGDDPNAMPRIDFSPFSVNRLPGKWKDF